jgi:hypothetical protein
MSSLILKRASASRPSGEWNDDDYDMLADGAAVGRIFKVHAAPVGTPTLPRKVATLLTELVAQARELLLLVQERLARCDPLIVRDNPADTSGI